MRRRRYLDKGEAIGRLVRFVAAFQAKNLVAPSIYAMAAAVGTSPSQAARLLRDTEEGGILRRASQSPLRYEVILIPPHLPGIVRIPLVECIWSQRIRWRDSGLRGVWLDRATYRIEGDAAGLWAITFPERPRDGATPCLRLNEHALALVRRCPLSEIKEDYWYLIELSGRVIVSCCVKKTGGTLLWRAGLGETAPDPLASKDIYTVCEVMMVTTRPPVPHAKAQDGSNAARMSLAIMG